MSNYYDEVFYPGALTDAQKFEFIKSKFWTPAIGIHLAMNKKIQVTHYFPDSERVSFAADNGITVAVFGFDKAKDQFYLAKASTGVNPNTFYKASIKSSNPRYIVSSLRKDSAARSEIEGHIDARSRYHGGILSHLYNAVESRYGRVEQNPSLLNGKLQNLLLRSYYGEAKDSEFDQNIKDALQTAKSEYANRSSIYQENINHVNELLDGDRWLVLYSGYGLTLTSCNTKGLALKYQGTPDQKVIIHEGYTPKFYPSIDAIPADIRTALIARLTLWKLHREHVRNLPTTPGDFVDTYGLLPRQIDPNGEYLPPAGAVLKAYDGGGVLLLAK